MEPRSGSAPGGTWPTIGPPLSAGGSYRTAGAIIGCRHLSGELWGLAQPSPVSEATGGVAPSGGSAVTGNAPARPRIADIIF